jgi:hypothetical protein
MVETTPRFSRSHISPQKREKKSRKSRSPSYKTYSGKFSKSHNLCNRGRMRERLKRATPTRFPYTEQNSKNFSQVLNFLLMEETLKFPKFNELPYEGIAKFLQVSHFLP